MSNVKSAINRFLTSNGPFHIAVTVNLKKRHHLYQVNNSLELAEKSGYWLIDRLNDSVFKRKYRFRKERLNSICAVEKGEIEKRFHLHLALGIPNHVSEHEFLNKLKKVHKKMEWAYGEPYISKYINTGWIDYICKEGFDSVLL